MKTNILIQVSVPFGDYCCGEDNNGGISRDICEYFDNEGGHPTCDLDRIFKGYNSLKYDDKGNVPKLPACLQGGGGKPAND